MENDARTKLCYLIESTPDTSVEAGIFIADHLIANDVVPVVRCKDCKHKTVTSDGMVCECALPTKRMQDYYIYGSTILARVEPDAFCSCGERREGK